VGEGTVSCPADVSPLTLTAEARGHPTDTPEDLRLAFRRHASGVAVITVPSPAGPVGFTATSLASVSARPPRLSFNISQDSSSWPALTRAGHVGVHILHARQEDLAARFATRGIDRFAEPTSWRLGPRRVPLLDGVAAWLVAAIDQRIVVGDHAIVVARVLHVGLDDDQRPPLLHHDGRFHGYEGPFPGSAFGGHHA